jgi:hypothetical protein
MLGNPTIFQRERSKLTWLSHVGFYLKKKNCVGVSTFTDRMMDV